MKYHVVKKNTTCGHRHRHILDHTAYKYYFSNDSSFTTKFTTVVFHTKQN